MLNFSFQDRISTKPAVLKKRDMFHLLEGFGSEPLSETMLENAEYFLVTAIAKGANHCKTFNELRVESYYKFKSSLNLGKLPCNSENIREHIKRSYYQCRSWIRSATHKDPSDCNPQQYGFKLEAGYLTANVLSPRPDIPLPCTCKKCARPNSCPCRVRDIACCKFCNCLSLSCQNPLNI